MRHWRLILCAFLLGLVLWLMALDTYGQAIPQALPAKTNPPEPFHVLWRWNGTNETMIFVYSNGVPSAVAIVRTNAATFSNLWPNVDYSAEVYSCGNGTPVWWFKTNYLGLNVFSTNLHGPWFPATNALIVNPPAAGFFWPTAFDNFITHPD